MDKQNKNNEEINLSGTGYLIVRTTTARSAVPVPGAIINIRGVCTENSFVLYSLKTDSNGMTEKVSLPAPPKALTQSENITRSFALYCIDVFADGYVPQSYINVPVFDGITSYQTADLVPVSASSRIEPFMSAEIYDSNLNES